MKSKALVLIVTTWAVLLCCVAWAQQGPATQESATTPSSAKEAKNEAKEKHWSGSLVDVGCMAQALGSSNSSAGAQSTPAQGMPHFAGEPTGQSAGQGPSGGPQGGYPPGGQRGPDQGATPTQTTSAGGVSPDEQAKLAQANRVDQAVKQCTASEATQRFALATSDGQVMQFDADGNAKAKDALKDASPVSGKKIKAKVTGTSTVENNAEVIKVASVDVKGKGKHGSGGSGS